MPLPPKGKMWEAGCGYLDTARGILGMSGGVLSRGAPLMGSCSEGLPCFSAVNSTSTFATRLSGVRDRYAAATLESPHRKLSLLTPF